MNDITHFIITILFIKRFDILQYICLYFYVLYDPVVYCPPAHLSRRRAFYGPAPAIRVCVSVGLRFENIDDTRAIATVIYICIIGDSSWLGRQDDRHFKIKGNEKFLFRF